MSKTFTLITAILMTLAALTWLASALLLPHLDGAGVKRWLIVAAFTALAGVYWMMYIRRKNAHKSGTE